MARLALVSLAWLALSLATSLPALAQSNQALAETLFQDGRRLMNAGNYAEACPKLQESQRLDPGTGTLLNWGLCLKELGKPASAWVVFNQAAASARAENRADRVQLAEAEIKKLEAAMPRLSVVVPPEADGPGLTVTVDAQTLAPAARGVASPVDPGQHLVVASAPERKTWTSSVDVKPGAQTYTVVVPVLEPGSDAVAAPATAPAAAGASASAGGTASGGEAPAAAPAPRERRFMLGARLNVAAPAGKFNDQLKLSDLTTAQGMLWFEAGYKVIPSLTLGVYVGFGAGSVGAEMASVVGVDCDGGVSCSVLDLRIGLQGAYNFNPAGKTQPWAGVGFGYELLDYSFESSTDQATVSFGGPEYLLLQGGLDFNMGAFGVGPFAALTLARYTTGSVTCDGCVDTLGGDIENAKVHQWLQLGVRGTFSL
jgi:hypothetical protein